MQLGTTSERRRSISLASVIGACCLVSAMPALGQAQVPSAAPFPGAPLSTASATPPLQSSGPAATRPVTDSGPVSALPVGALLPRDPRPGEPITLNFNNVDLDAAARAMASIAGKQVIIDPRVKGNINLITDRPVAPAVAFGQFLAALRLQGYAVVETAGLYKVLPEVDAKVQGGAVALPIGRTVAGGQMVTQIFQLSYESANNLVPVLRPLISPNNTINVNPGNNSLVITDYEDNLQRIAKIVATLDVSNATDVEILPLKHALASDLLPILTRLVDASAGTGAAQGQADTSYKTVMLAEPRSNAIIVRAANPARVSLVRSLVAKLDAPSATGNGAAGNIHVVHLKNAEAVKLAATLRAALSATTSGGTSALASAALSSALPTSSPSATGAGAAAASSNTATAQSSTGGQIQADAATNSLIITAAEPQYRQIRAVIDALDARRAQVFVEGLIAEVNDDKAAEFGIQWQGASGNSTSSNIGLLGTNFTSPSAATNIIALAAGAAKGTVTPSPGLNFGVAHNTNGLYVLGFLARFLESTGDGNVLSTPTLLTLDNEEAKIIVGQNVPFITGQYTNANSTTTVNPFQTIERKDVGLTIRVKPQVSENGSVRLATFIEVSSVEPTSVGSTSGLITNKRSIESNVLVEDGNIVVLGGLLQDQYTGSKGQVPGLGDLPVLGSLFKSETRDRKKTNLMLFLRPVVLRDAESLDSLSQSRYEQMRANQRSKQAAPNLALPVPADVEMRTQPLPARPTTAPATPSLGAKP